MSRNRITLVVGLLVAFSMMLASCAPATTPTVATIAPTAVPTAAPARHGGWLDQIVFSVASSDSAVTQIQAGAIDVFAYPLSSAQLASIQAAGLNYATTLGTYYTIMYNGANCTDPNTFNPFADRKIREATNMLYDRDYINQEIYAGGGLPKFFTIQTNGIDYADLADVALGLQAKYAFNEAKAIADIAAEMNTLPDVTKGADGFWQYKGQTITPIFLVRQDGDGTRKPMGDYVTAQLVKAGFKMDERYKKSSEAGPIWQRTSVECEWNVYTAGWINTGLERDAKGDFQQMYLPDSTQGIQPFLSNVADPAFQKVGDDLANGNFTTIQQRHDMMAQALPLSMQDSLQVMIIDTRSFAPYSTKVQISANLASGIETPEISFYTARFAGQEGGTLKWGESDVFTEPWNPVAGSNWAWDQGAISATSSGAFMADPYTGLQWPLRAEKAELVAQTGLPIFKSLDWITLTTADTINVPADAWVDWDAKTQTFITTSQLDATIADAKTKKATYDAMVATNQPLLESKANDLAVAVNFTKFTKDTVTGVVTDLAAYLKQLTGQDTDVASLLSSPDTVAAIDALVKEINSTTTTPALTPAEKAAKVKDLALSYVKIADFDPALAALAAHDADTAKIKSTIYYPANIFDTVTWHDGSKLSPADFVMSMIMWFDRAKTDSAIYDDQAVPGFESFMSSFKGVKIVSTNPLVIDTYSDNYQPDAELDITTWWPNYNFGEAPWEVMSVANLAEAAGECAYSSDKSAAKNVEQTSFVGGPTLAILAKYLDQAIAANTIPYAPTMSAYLTTADATARYAALKTFYTDRGHFWVGTGPYYLYKAFLVEKSLILQNYSAYPDTPDRWANFAAPQIAVVAITPPAGGVTIGQPATFDVSITFNGQPYASKDLKMVKYLLFDATGAIVKSDLATLASEGDYQVVLPAEVTSTLAAGSNKLEIAAVSNLVAVPTFLSVQFVTAP